MYDHAPTFYSSLWLPSGKEIYMHELTQGRYKTNNIKTDFVSLSFSSI